MMLFHGVHEVERNQGDWNSDKSQGGGEERFWNRVPDLRRNLASD